MPWPDWPGCYPWPCKMYSLHEDWSYGTGWGQGLSVYRCTFWYVL